MANTDDLFQDVRDACSARSWSQGIELARADAVDGLSVNESTATLRVRVPGRTVAPTVTLHFDDGEWVCDCDSTADVCEHVAAAVIALRRANREGKPLPSSAKAGGKLRYRLSADGDRLAIERIVVTADKEEPLRASLAGVLSGREKGPAVEPTQIDLTIDKVLSQRRVRSLAADALAPLWPLLAQADDVRLDDQRVRVADKPLGPRVVVRDGPQRGALLRFEPSSRLLRVVVSGVALASGDDGAPELVLLGLIDVTGPKLGSLPCESRYDADRIAELIGQVLPRLREKADVVMEASHLPDRQRSLRPRALIRVEQHGAALSVLPLIVYGDPPCARVDDGALVHLGGPVPERDPRGERRAAEALRAELDLAPGRRLDLVGRDAVEMAQRLRAYRGDVDGTAHRDRYPEGPLGLRIDARDGGLGVEAQSGEQGADATEVLRAWREGMTVAPLLGGGWAPLPLDWLSRYGERLEQILAARDASGKLAAHARPALAALCRDLDTPCPPDIARLRGLAEGFGELPRAELPSDMRAELRDYQRRGVDWLCFLRDADLGAVLADDMGLGKTVQALAALQGRTLVVCPRSVVHNWADEIRRFRPGLRHAIYHGADRALDERADVTLTTYALLRADIEMLSGITWDAIVLDESQTIKNPDSQVAQAAFRLRARFRLTLSGTPVENRLSELWSQMHFANPGLLGGKSAFQDRFATPIENGDGRAGGRLRARIRPFVLRRTKKEVLPELPPRTEMVLPCELDSRERDVYDAIALATRTEILRELEAGGVMAALEALLRLRQAACDIALVPGSPSDRTSSKIRRLMLSLEQAAADGHKALVFSQWTSLLDRVEPSLREAAVPFNRLDGGTRDREAVVRAFQDPAGPPVMLISLKAGGTGLNLTAADHVFLLDPWWNPAVEDQAADRAHRIGQDRPVMIYRLVAKDTVEERILSLQEHKRALAATALDGAGAAGSLTRDDLLALLA